MTEGLEDTHVVDPLLARVIAGKMELRAVLGAGAMGVVYRAHHLALDKTIAIKVLRSEGKSDPTRARRFKAEARAASRLDHPNSVHILDFGEDGSDGLLYLAMEFLEGEDLQSLLKREYALAPDRAARIMIQVLGALSAAHDSGVIHRDMKPGNVMLLRRTDDDGRTDDFVKVCDFGLAKILDGLDDASGAPLTKQGAIFGTPAYMSPEQARGETLDGRTDVYACGVILYKILTGEAPFAADTAWGILMQHLNDPVPPMSRWVADLPPELVRITERALAKEREQRFQSAREMRAALKAFLRESGEEGELSAPVQAMAPVQRSPSLTEQGSSPPRGRSRTVPAETVVGSPPTAAEARPLVDGTIASGSVAPAEGRGQPWLWVVAVVVLAGVFGAWAFMRGPKSEAIEVPSASPVASASPVLPSTAPLASASPVAPSASPVAPSASPVASPEPEPSRSPVAPRPTPSPTASASPSATPAASAPPSTAPELEEEEPDPTRPHATRRPVRPRRPTRELAAPTVTPLASTPPSLPPAVTPTPTPTPATPSATPSPIASATPVPAVPTPAGPPAPTRVDMKIDGVKVTGGMSGRAVETRLGKAVEAARKCVERAVVAGKKPARGVIEVRGTVDLRGRLSGVKVSGALVGSSGACLVEALEGTALPKPDTGEALLAFALDYQSS